MTVIVGCDPLLFSAFELELKPFTRLLCWVTLMAMVPDLPPARLPLLSTIFVSYMFTWKTFALNLVSDDTEMSTFRALEPLMTYFLRVFRCCLLIIRTESTSDRHSEYYYLRTVAVCENSWESTCFYPLFDPSKLLYNHFCFHRILAALPPPLYQHIWHIFLDPIPKPNTCAISNPAQILVDSLQGLASS